MEQMNIVIAGHVDHGKSTVIGRLLADTHSLPQGKLEQIKALCAKTSRPFEYAFLLDALKDERAQGITIDSARVFFKTKKRHYIIIDAPGHIEFLKNMVSGASRADAALLVIDAQEGIQENSRRHAYMLSMLGISQIAVLVNKMDLIGYSEASFKKIVAEFNQFLAQINLRPRCFIPVSGFHGDNIAERSSRMSWYDGGSVLDQLDLFIVAKSAVDKPFRMPVQDVYKFTKNGDDRRIVAGTVESGTLKVGDEVVFYPSGKKSTVKTIEAFNRPPQTEVRAGYAASFTLTEQVYITRGEVAAISHQPRPDISTRLNASLFWLGKEPMSRNQDYILKLGTARVPVRIEEIVSILDASNLKTQNDKDSIARHSVADCVLKLGRPVAFDVAAAIANTSRFVIVDRYEISGGGIIKTALDDKESWAREKVLLRNYKWDSSFIGAERRAERYNQKASLILITGAKAADRKRIAKRLEARLFNEGRIVYFLGIGNLLYGVDADIKDKSNSRKEHIRRLAEVAHILLDVGVILIVTANELVQDDLELIKTMVESDRIETVVVGDTTSAEISYDLCVGTDADAAIDKIKSLLQDRGIIFKP